MKIDRHNYEEYFILYMDNELGCDERHMVEAFVLNHPDLKEELDILLQYKLEPDTNIVFADKQDLLKKNGNIAVNNNNYEEWLMLYIDKELTGEQKTGVEQFVIENPFVEKELLLLQKTRLKPEEIVFRNKELLYRKEQKVHRIPVLRWRVAAAVLIFSIGLTTAIVLNYKPSGIKEGMAKNDGNDQKINTKNPEGAKDENKQLPLKIISDDRQNAVAATSKPTKNIVVKKDNNAGTDVKLNKVIPAPIKKKEEGMANNNKRSNNLPQPLNNSTVNNGQLNVNATAKNTIQNPLTNADVTNKSTPPSDIVQASVQELVDAEMGQSGSKKSKLRGFFRKVTRTFEKRTNIDPTDNEERLLVGGLAIKLK